MSVASQANPNQFVLSDDRIQADIWSALWQEEKLRADDLDSLSVAVQDGEVFLNGYVSSEQIRGLIERVIEACAQSLPGVGAVHNRLIVDHDLTMQVAQALAADERTRSFILPVGSSDGWVRLGGEVPTRDLQLAAEEVAGRVASVRGVVALPRVAGINELPARRAVQPRIGASVYGENGQVGVVTQVVIQPRSRLVTHMVVSARALSDGRLVSAETVVPVESAGPVQNEGIFLARNEPALSAFPAFDPAVYPPAPSTWQPPYPYAAGDVRWSYRETPAAGNL